MAQSERDWKAEITWTTGQGDNTAELIQGVTRATARRKLVAAERRLRGAGAHIRSTHLFREGHP